MSNVIDGLLSYLAALPPGPILVPADLERLLSNRWDEFSGDDAGMEGRKLLARMRNVFWSPPILTFTIERHGSTVMGSSRAPLQEWTLDVEKMTAHCVERGYRQVRPRQRHPDIDGIAEEIARFILAKQNDDRLKWYEDGRVRVLVGKVIPEGSAVKQTLADRRRKLRAGVRRRLTENGWEEAGVNVYRRKAAKEVLNNAEIASKMS